MTPPDSGERLYCTHGCNHRATSCDVCAACAHFVAEQAERKPDSGEREVLALECPFCAHPDHADKSCPECGCYRYPADLAVPHKDPAVSIPLPLAQRILAALVYDADGFGEHAALAAELRARVEGKS